MTNDDICLINFILKLTIMTCNQLVFDFTDNIRIKKGGMKKVGLIVLALFPGFSVPFPSSVVPFPASVVGPLPDLVVVPFPDTVVDLFPDSVVVQFPASVVVPFPVSMVVPFPVSVVVVVEEVGSGWHPTWKAPGHLLSS